MVEVEDDGDPEDPPCASRPESAPPPLSPQVEEAFLFRVLSK